MISAVTIDKTASATIIARRRSKADEGMPRLSTAVGRTMVAMVSELQLLGVDFTSAPSRRKPITVARGALAGTRVSLHGLEELRDFAAFEALLRSPGPWLGAFDFPFGLPRPFADDVAPGADAAGLMAALQARCARRIDFRALVDRWGNARPAGQRLLHRRTDGAGAVSSTSPLQTRYVPVGFMYFEGMARLLAAGVHLPGLHEGDRARIALEAYPGRLAGELLGRRSYKNGADDARLIARRDLLTALELGRVACGLRVKLSPAQHDAVAADAQGDRIDALLCLVQAAQASRTPNYGLPNDVDPVEGWIVGA
jgi:hypothetical protein